MAAEDYLNDKTQVCTWSTFGYVYDGRSKLWMGNLLLGITYMNWDRWGARDQEGSG
jgi:hypothetical protein